MQARVDYEKPCAPDGKDRRDNDYANRNVVTDGGEDALREIELHDDADDNAPVWYEDEYIPPLTRIKNAVSQAAEQIRQAFSRFGQALQVAWSRLNVNAAAPAPHTDMPSDPNDDILDEDYVDDNIIDDDYVSVYDALGEQDDIAGGADGDGAYDMDDEAQPSMPAQPAVDMGSYPDRLISAKRRRPTAVHTPFIPRQETNSAPAPLRFHSEMNDLIWDRPRGMLTITEPIPDEVDTMDPRGKLRKKSVTLTVRLMDERIVPILHGVINAIGGMPAEPMTPPIMQTADNMHLNDDGINRRIRRADRHAAPAESVPQYTQDLPYVCESGQNTFCWYRASQILKIYGQKRVDDKGLLHTSRCVALHAAQLPSDARPLFVEILNMRARGNASLLI